MTGTAIDRDDEERRRDVARRLDRKHPAWTVWYGPRTGRYWAMPARGVASPLLEADRPEALEAAMREVETWYGIGREPLNGAAPTAPRPSVRRAVRL
ncbi:hypothetical protein GCM10009678_79690 [Actinomadura kijaniata]|uniref:Uncharacterized protein n=1 Tax=Actinomadura namibiensis TaxID=182080 RepID=A0A7W3QIP2_ACTNM|nr:hypothetical protein [Actinomadura namibiensis]MBA8948505.1 hypothetical protein [Actinomadura namibiensis]